MVPLIFNSVLRIRSDDLHGFYRVVAAPAAHPTVWLAFIGPCDEKQALAGKQLVTPRAPTDVARDTICALGDEGVASIVELQPCKKLLIAAEALKPSERELLERRQRVMEPFFDHGSLCDVLTRTHGVGELVNRALRAGNMSRASIYRLWRLLCEHGFEVSSLNPRFELCGAPGVLRPVAAGAQKAGAKSRAELLQDPLPCPQFGVSADDRAKILLHHKLLAKPGLSFGDLYTSLIERIYVHRYESVGDVRKPILPPQGKFPNSWTKISRTRNACRGSIPSDPGPGRGKKCPQCVRSRQASSRRLTELTGACSKSWPDFLVLQAVQFRMSM